MGWRSWFSTHAQGTSDPDEVRNWYIHVVASIASCSAIAMGYYSTVTSGVMALDSFTHYFGVDDMSANERDNLQANIVSTFQIGCLFGALLTFPLGEKFGRKKTIMGTALVFTAGAILMAASSGKVAMVIVGRALAGLGVGASTLAVPIYISETSPPSIRGRLIGLFEIGSQGGGLVGFWINYGVDQHISDRSTLQYTLPLALQVLPGILLFVGMFFCPESPRWLARGDNFEAAEKVLARIRNLPADHPYIQNEMSEIREQLTLRSTNKMSRKVQFKKLFQKGVRNRMAIGLALGFLQSWTGTNVMSYYAPRIFETLGLTGTANQLFSTGLYGVFALLGMCIYTFIVAERVGRRKGLVWGAFLACIPMFYNGGYVLIADPAAASAAGRNQTDDWAYLAIACVYINAIIVTSTWQGITWTYPAEIFPLDIRMLCVAVTTAFTWLGSFIVARVAPYMMTGIGYGTFFMFGAILIVIGFWALFFIPETKGISLEDMDGLFSIPTYKTCWASLTGKSLDIPSSGYADDSVMAEKGEFAEAEVREMEKGEKD